MAGSRGIGRFGPRCPATVVSSIDGTERKRLVVRRSHHVCCALLKKKELAPILRPLLAALEEARPANSRHLRLPMPLWKPRNLSCGRQRSPRIGTEETRKLQAPRYRTGS